MLGTPSIRSNATSGPLRARSRTMCTATVNVTAQRESRQQVDIGGTDLDACMRTAHFPMAGQ